MNQRIRVFLGLSLAAIALFTASCAHDAATTNRDRPGQNRYSSMPQNRPQSWEGQGMLGGMAGYQ